ncbi:MAG TPA: hypothetical protein VHE35_00515 [Kofleriaceae bacterium]|nr:hypothetical protein [Kofleriaceae bacterium]
MAARRIVAIVSTCAVAIALALMVPVAQLALAAPTGPTCCCPRPELCHCPEHHPRPDGNTSVRACRDAPPATANLQFPAFAPPAGLAVVDVRAASTPVTFALRAPHAPPLLDERAAPS